MGMAVSGLERNDSSFRREAEKRLRSSYENLLGRNSRQFELDKFEGDFVFYHHSLPLIVTPSIPGNTTVEIYVDSMEARVPEDLVKGLARLDRMKKGLESKGYDFTGVEFRTNPGHFYTLQVKTEDLKGVEKILVDCNEL